jgi:dihydromethanopterin reductase
VSLCKSPTCIGLSGQFGLRGRLPWEGNRDREYVADVERFFDLTRGQVLIMGRRTFSAVPDLAFKDRDIVEICLRQAGGRAGARVVFIGGGPPTTLPTRLPSAIGTSTGCPMTPRFVDRAEVRELADSGECPHLVLSDGRKPA